MENSKVAYYYAVQLRPNWKDINVSDIMVIATNDINAKFDKDYLLGECHQHCCPKKTQHTILDNLYNFCYNYHNHQFFILYS